MGRKLEPRIERLEALSALAQLAAGVPEGRNVFSATNVYINALTGKDDNDGLTPATAWATNAGFAAAVGIYGLLTVPGTTSRWFSVIYQGAMPTDLLNLQCVLDENVCLRFLGAALVTTLHSGTFTAAIPYTAPNTRGSVTDTAVTTWAPYINKRITWTGGTAIGAHAWIAKDLGASAARISGPARVNDVVVTNISFPTPVAPSTGTYTIDNLPTLLLGNFDVQGTRNGNVIETFVNFFDFSMQSSGPQGADPQPTGVGMYFQLQACECTWQSMAFVTVTFCVCSFPNGTAPEASTWAYYAACLIQKYFFMISGSVVGVQDWTLAEGCGYTSLDGSYLDLLDCAAENAVSSFANQFGDGVTNVSLAYTPGTIVASSGSPVMGDGNAGVGWRVAADTTCSSPYSVPTVTGTGGDLVLGTTSTTAWAWNDTTGAYIAPKRSLTWALVAASVASGGFGGQPADVRHASYFVGPDS
jgi:hypothetical protein